MKAIPQYNKGYFDIRNKVDQGLVKHPGIFLGNSPRNPKPETRNPKPEARNPKPEKTRNSLTVSCGVSPDVSPSLCSEVHTTHTFHTSRTLARLFLRQEGVDAGLFCEGVAYLRWARGETLRLSVLLEDA